MPNWNFVKPYKKNKNKNFFSLRSKFAALRAYFNLFGLSIHTLLQKSPEYQITLFRSGDWCASISRSTSISACEKEHPCSGWRNSKYTSKKEKEPMATYWLILLFFWFYLKNEYLRVLFPTLKAIWVQALTSKYFSVLIKAKMIYCRDSIRSHGFIKLFIQRTIFLDWGLLWY